MTSATDELRRLLDERGVEHYDGTECTYWGDTVLARRDGTCPVYRFSAIEVVDGLSVNLLRVTPEQAIDATLGRGTCRDLAETPDYRYKTQFECSECGYEYSSVGGFGCDYGDEPDFRYCPNCGAKVVE